MYTEIGEVSEATITQLLSILNEATWEVHTSDITEHQASICTEQCQALEELVALWPVDTWHQMSFLRLRSGGKLYRHHDDGFGFHIPVETNNQAISISYENGLRKEQHLEVGKLYHVDRSIEHESFNNGETDRTHLIVLLKEPPMTRSKRSDEGLLIIDNRNSPGVEDRFMPGFGVMPTGIGKGLFEVPTYSCSHCPQQVVMNPMRRRPRGYCRKCDAYICDRCNGILAATRVCKPYEQVLDELQEQGLKEEKDHVDTIIISKNLNTDSVR